MGGRMRNPRYEDAEAHARKNRLGLWRHNMNLAAIRGETETVYKPVNFSKRLVVVEVASANELYL